MTAYRRVGVRTCLVVLLLSGSATLAGCTVRYAVDQGALYYNRHQIDRADRKLSRVVDKDPTNWRGLYYLGLVRLEQDRPRDAELLLDRSLSLHNEAPETPQILDGLAEALYRQNRTANLFAVLEHATEYYGTSYDFTRQGKYMAKSGDPDAALLAFKKAVRFADPRDPTPYLAMADFYEQVGDVPNAITALRHAYTILPNDPFLAERFRRHGIVPGPSLTVEPGS